MRILAVTGVPRCYIEMVAETIKECVELHRINGTKFLPEGSMELVEHGHAADPTLSLRVFLTPKPDYTCRYCHKSFNDHIPESVEGRTEQILKCPIPVRHLGKQVTMHFEPKGVELLDNTPQ